MDVTVDQAIENIWECKSEEDFLDVTLTLLKLIQNVIFNPDKPKFKKIKRNTAVRFSKLLDSLLDINITFCPQFWGQPCIGLTMKWLVAF